MITKNLILIKTAMSLLYQLYLIKYAKCSYNSEQIEILFIFSILFYLWRPPLRYLHFVIVKQSCKTMNGINYVEINQG